MNGIVKSRLLVLETSGKVGQVALALGPELQAVRQLDEARRHARDLAPVVAALLASQSWGPRDLDAVIVSRGPGSYTGLRVGIMSAKTLAFATGCGLVGVETFAAIARQAPAGVDQVDVIADAQQEKVYAQSFSRRAADAPLEAQGPLEVLVLADWLTRRDGASWVTGPGARAYPGRLSGAVRFLPEECWDPRPEHLLELGLQRHALGERDDLGAAEPLYLRPSSAEEKRPAR